MFSTIRLIINIILDLIAAMLITFAVVMVGYAIVLMIIFTKTDVMEVVGVAAAAAFVVWRLIRWFGF